MTINDGGGTVPLEQMDPMAAAAAVFTYVAEAERLQQAEATHARLVGEEEEATLAVSEAQMTARRLAGEIEATRARLTEVGTRLGPSWEAVVGPLVPRLAEAATPEPPAGAAATRVQPTVRPTRRTGAAAQEDRQ